MIDSKKLASTPMPTFFLPTLLFPDFEAKLSTLKMKEYDKEHNLAIIPFTQQNPNPRY